MKAGKTTTVDYIKKKPAKEKLGFNTSEVREANRMTEKSGPLR